MHTPTDLVSLILFAGLAVIFLQRSASKDTDPVALWKYAAGAIGCAAGDILGNHGQPFIGWGVLAATGVFAAIFLIPLKIGRR